MDDRTAERRSLVGVSELGLGKPENPQVPDLFGLALITRRPGQDRKVAAKAGDSSAGMWLVGPPPVSAIQQVTANTPFRPLGNPLHVDESGVFKVHFQLSSHAICSTAR